MMASATKRQRQANLCLAAVVAAAVIAATVLYRFPPMIYSFYPVCPVHHYLHFECPGCGATRAMAALLHGRLRDALRWNALFVAVVLPGAVSWGSVAYLRAVRDEESCWPRLPAGALYAGAALVGLFTVMRNF